jgi:Na+-transporting methylmalonyl-CoA/oxaloacetate decarboxylase beta subunit
MTIFAVASVLVGMAMGFRFKVFILMPVTLVTVICGGVIAFALGDHGWVMVATMVVGIVSLQIGYLCGTFAHAVLRETRAPDPVPVSSERKSAYKSKLGLGIRA